MPNKAIDQRIPALLKNCAEANKRSLFVIIGDHARDQVVNLHYLQTKIQASARPSILWMYKKELAGFTSHRKKREKKIKKQIKRGIRDADKDNPFELFLSTTEIRYCYYKESEKILGQTYGMLILQDFEALTPNLLARTIETVKGGGSIILLLKTMKSLKQLYSMTMDVHSRYRTVAHQDVTARFNERFILSLSSCRNCLIVDDELNVLPISGAWDVRVESNIEKKEANGKKEEFFNVDHLSESKEPLGALKKLTKTEDQAKTVKCMMDCIQEKLLKCTVAVTAARGRGKSASLGLALAGATFLGYSNIFLTSPVPENLKTVFEFLFKGLDVLGLEEHLDYDIVQSSQGDLKNVIVRVNIFKNHRQTIQYIKPGNYHVLGQAEILVIDEAAAIPLPIVKKLMGPYLVFMSSTIHGYEGTGRSLSLKLLRSLRQQSSAMSAKTVSQISGGGKELREIVLTNPIRYSSNDDVEQWLNELLCLDVDSIPRNLSTGCPHPSTCSLYYVNRDTLFSYHRMSETFLRKMMNLYVSSHYKNSPNDLQLMSDAPAHSLYVLLPPVEKDSKTMPEPLCVIQVALEGEISRQIVLNSLSRGSKAAGDLVPWTITQQYQNPNFARLAGARIVRIATNPDFIKMGYGTRALEQLIEFYEGKFVDFDREQIHIPADKFLLDEDLEISDLLHEKIEVRDSAALPPLLLKLSELSPPKLDYVGSSFGLTEELFRFWRRQQFIPLYIRQTPNELTGEHSAIILKMLSNVQRNWLSLFVEDFRRRFLVLLSYQFSSFDPSLCIEILESTETRIKTSIGLEDLENKFSMFEIKRLEAYANNMLDFHAILDALPIIATLFFQGSFYEKLLLSAVQKVILLAIGLQHKTVEIVSQDLDIPVNQILANLTKIVKKFVKLFQDTEKIELKAELMEDELKEGNTLEVHRQLDGNVIRENMKRTSNGNALEEKQKELISSLDLEQYKINERRYEWDSATEHIAHPKIGSSQTVSVRRTSSVNSPDRPDAKKRKQ